MTPSTGLEGQRFPRRDVFPIMRTSGKSPPPAGMAPDRSPPNGHAKARRRSRSDHQLGGGRLEEFDRASARCRGSAPQMSTMRAAVLRGWNDLVVEEVDVPTPAPGEVLLRVRACGLCGTDLKMVHGAFQQRGWPPSLPFFMGHECGGWSPSVEESDDLELQPGTGRGGRPRRLRALPDVPGGRYNLCEKSAPRVPSLRTHRPWCSRRVRRAPRADAAQVPDSFRRRDLW